MRIHRALRSPSAWLAFSLLASGATAALADYGRPVDWQMGMQDMATNLGQSVASFHDWVTILMGVVVLFVLGLIVAVVVKFNENANPTPSRTTHHTILEVAWAVVPVGKIVRVQVTAADVLHSFAVPSFGFKVDAVPGRLNEMWFKADREGVYYGQCSELCGQYHAFMPIAIRVVSEERYGAWLAEAKQKFARTGPATEFAAGGKPAATSVAAAR